MVKVVKLVFGISFLLMGFITSLLFLTECLGISSKIINLNNHSFIFLGETRQVFIFLGICVFSGAYLISSLDREK